MSQVRRLLTICMLTSGLIGCNAALPTVTATTTTTPPPPIILPTDTPAASPASRTPSVTLETPTAVPSASRPPVPSFTPTVTATPPPTPHPLSIAPIPQPQESISSSNAGQIAPLARWTGDEKSPRLVFAPHGRLMAVTSPQGVHLYDVQTQKQVGFVDGGDHRVSGVAFTPDGEALAVGVYTQGVRLWDVTGCTSALSGSEKDSPQECAEFLRTLRGDGGEIRAMGLIAFSLDGETLATEGPGGTVELWRVAGCADPSLDCAERLHTLEIGEGSLASLSFSADGQTLLTGATRSSISSDGTVRLWAVASGERLHDLTLDGRRENRAIFAPDGATLAAVGDDERVTLWRVQDGMPLRHLIGHTERTRAVVFSPDGTILATSGADQTIRLWRLADGVLLHTLQDRANTLLFSPDGAWLISIPGDYGIQFWDVDSSASAPSPTPRPSHISTATGLFTRVAGLPEGEIRQIWIAPDGQPWLVTETGIYLETDGGWQSVFDGLANRVLGTDDDGRVWATVNNGWRIGAYASTGQSDAAWTFYDASQGWSRSDGRGLVADRLGRVWVSTRQDLRRFDPQVGTWTTFSADEIGFPPLEEPLDPGRSLTNVALDSAGNVWVGSCTNDGIAIMGDGVRWFDGDGWSGSVDTAGECVYDIAVDSVGRVWMGGFDALIQYDPAAGVWTRFPLPTWERRQLINRLALDAAGQPWVSFTRFGPTGPWHSNAVYHLEDGEWVANYDPGIDMSILLALDPDGTAWVCAEGAIYHLSGDEPEEIDAVGWCRQIVVDGSGSVWIVGDFNLWRFVPEK